MTIHKRIKQIAEELGCQVELGYSAYGSGSWWATIEDARIKEQWYCEDGSSAEAALSGALNKVKEWADQKKRQSEAMAAGSSAALTAIERLVDGG